MKFAVTIIVLFFSSLPILAQNNADDILGKWITYPKKNLIVEVYKEDAEYKGKIVWFIDDYVETEPINSRTDNNNPDPALRDRKLIGLEVLNDLVYDPEDNRWENGNIYDAKSGRTWSSSAGHGKNGILSVRGFWKFEFIGKSLHLKKINEN